MENEKKMNKIMEEEEYKEQFKPDTKIESMWKISREVQENFIRELDCTTEGKMSIDEVEDLFKMIRGAEYRRGKADGIKETKKETLTEEEIFEEFRIRGLSYLPHYENPITHNVEFILTITEKNLKKAISKILHSNS